jgi:pantothenate kinase
MQTDKSNTKSAAHAKIVSTVNALASDIAATAGRCRTVVAIVGAPGSGKSTTSELVRSELQDRAKLRTQILPMDGFHLDNAILKKRDLLSRKGSPATFDVDGLANILMRLTREPSVDVVVPVFDRENDLSRGSAREINAATQVILVEGNYLLLNEKPWTALAAYFNRTVMIHCEESVLRHRLMKRWLDLDFSEEDARIKVEANDLPNAVTVLSQSEQADITFVAEDS